MQRGRTAFGKFLKEKEISYAEAAEAIGRTRQYVGLLATRRRNVTPELAVRIAEWAKSRGGDVPASSWPNLRALAKLG